MSEADKSAEKVRGIPFKSGAEWNGNAKGRPKGSLSIKDLVRKHLESNPDDLIEFVSHFIKKNRELAWTMLEGKPAQSTDITSKGKELKVIFDSAFNSETKGDETTPSTKGDSEQ